jgi:uncharacterized protein (TIGR03067 family)
MAPLTNRAEDKQPPVEGSVCAATHEGVWKPIAGAVGGVEMPDTFLRTIALKITDTNYEVTVEDAREPDKGTCTLDTSASPKRMTIKGTEGPNRGKTFLAIYEMKDASSMRVCYDLSGMAFPKDFEAPTGTKQYLFDYRRQE